MVIELPDISFIRENDFSPFHVQHLNYFSPKTMSWLLERSSLATYSITTFKNYDIARDPHMPTLLAVAKKDSRFLSDGEKLRREVLQIRDFHRKRIQARTDSKTKIGIVGCGDALYPVRELLGDLKISAVFDNNSKLWGKEVFGIRIQSVEEIGRSNLDLVIIATILKYNTDQIKKQIVPSIPEDKIFTLFD